MAKVLAQAVAARQAETVPLPGTESTAVMAGAMRDNSAVRELVHTPARGAGGVSGFEAAALAVSAGNDLSSVSSASSVVMDPLGAAPEVAIAQKLQVWILRGVQTAELQLDAAGGGAVDVSVSVQGNEAYVEFRSDQPEARRLLQDAMPHLKELLRAEGMLLSGGFVGTSARQDQAPQGQKSTAQHSAMFQAKPEGAVLALGANPARRSGRAIDVFV